MSKGWKTILLYKVNYIDIHVYSEFQEFQSLKIRYTDPRAQFSPHIGQQSTVVVAKDSDILHYFNLSIYSLQITIAII